MKIVSVINYKGGVGKTTLTANLGAELAYRGHRVLMIDCDPQASLTFSFISADTWQERFEESGTIKEWFDRLFTKQPIKLSSVIESPHRVSQFLGASKTLDMVYSHLGLINVDLELAIHLGGMNIRQTKARFIEVHGVLSRALNLIEGYDIVLIDCPPNFNITTKTALIASSHILVPTRADYLSIIGIDYLIRSMKSLIGDYNDFAAVSDGDPVDPLAVKGMSVVFTMVQEWSGRPIRAQRQFISEVVESFRDDDSNVSVMDAYIKRNDSLLGVAPSDGIPAVLSMTNGKTYERVIDGLETVTTEFLAFLGGH